MPKIKIKPINIEKATSIKGVGKNISDVVDFIVSVSSEINRVVAEVNKGHHDPLPPYDDSALKKEIKKVSDSIVTYDDSAIKKSIAAIKRSIPEEFDDSLLKKEIKAVSDSVKNYDDSDLKEQIKSVAGSIPLQYDDTELLKQVAMLISQNKNLSSEIESLKKSAIANQKEIRSNRKEAGYKIDVLEQKVNKVTEIE